MPSKTAPAGAKPEKVTAAHIRRGLRKYFPDGRCGIVFECAQGTGWQANRHIDALAMDLWPSHGLIIHAIEIKVDRADWRRELKDPAKAEQLARFADKFWVAAPPGVVPVDELPHAWGLLEGGAEGMRVTKQAEKTAAQPVDRNLLAAVFRASGRSLDADESALALHAARTKLETEFDERLKNEAARLSENNSTDAENWRLLMTALGGIDETTFRKHVHKWDAEKWIATIKAVHGAGVMEHHHGLAGLLATVADFQKRLVDANAMLNAPVDEALVDGLLSIGKKGKR